MTFLQQKVEKLIDRLDDSIYQEVQLYKQHSCINYTQAGSPEIPSKNNFL